MAGLNTGSDTYFGWMEGDPVDWDNPTPAPLPDFTDMPHDPASVQEAIEPSFSTQARGSQAEHGRTNEIAITASIPFDWRHQGFEKPVQNVFEIVSNTEVAAIVVTSANNKIDFKESDLGTELTASIPVGTYSTATLAAAAKAAVDAELSGGDTSTFTYVRHASKWTISSTGDYLLLLWHSGSNADESARVHFGFTDEDQGDDESPISITSDGTVSILQDNVFELPEDLDLPQPNGMTWYQHLNKYTNLLWNVFVNVMSWAVNANFLKFTMGINAGRVTEAEDSPIAYVPYAERPAVVKGYMSVTIDDTANGGLLYENVRTKSLTINVPSPVAMEFADHATYAVDAARTDKIKPEVSFSWFLNDRTTMDEALQDRYRSGTPISMTVTITSPIPFSSGHYKRTVFHFPSLIRKGASPNVTGPGPIEQPYSFIAQLGYGETTAMRLTLRNAKYIAIP